MAGIPRRQGRAEPKIGPSDSSDSYAEGQELSTDTDAVPNPSDLKTDRVVTDKEAGLGGGLDQAEEARLGVTDEELDKNGFRKPKP
jgi:hypothetical protein